MWPSLGKHNFHPTASIGAAWTIFVFCFFILLFTEKCTKIGDEVSVSIVIADVADVALHILVHFLAPNQHDEWCACVPWPVLMIECSANGARVTSSAHPTLDD